MNIKEFILDAVAEDPRLLDYDLSEGTNIYDLIVKPSQQILENIKIDELVTEINSLDLANYEELTTAQLRRIASNHLVRIADPVNTTGQIFLHFSEPIDWDIEQGTTLYSSETRFEISNSIALRKTDFIDRYASGSYVSYPIAVSSETGVHIAENTLGRLHGAPATLLKITHEAMTNGVSEYTNQEMYSIIKQSLSSRQALSRNGIGLTLQQNFRNIGRVEIVGKGDPLMKRDLLYNTVINDGYVNKIADFSAKVRGRANAGCKSSAYTIFDTNPQTNSPGNWGEEIELQQQQYERINENENKTITISTSDILSETFTQSSEVAGNSKAITSITRNTDATPPDTTLTIADTDGYEVGQPLILHFYNSAGNALPLLNAIITSIEPNSVANTILVTASIPVSYDGFINSFCDIVYTEGLSIGNQWIGSEDGLSIGQKLMPEEIEVVGGELVLGGKNNGYVSNVMVGTITRTGVEKFVSAIKESITAEIYDDKKGALALKQTAVAKTTSSTR